MSIHFVCPQGHQWELKATVETPATELPVLCSVCGAAHGSN